MISETRIAVIGGGPASTDSFSGTIYYPIYIPENRSMALLDHDLSKIDIPINLPEPIIENKKALKREGKHWRRKMNRCWWRN